jgi:hypothetical protein
VLPSLLLVTVSQMNGCIVVVLLLPGMEDSSDCSGEYSFEFCALSLCFLNQLFDKCTAYYGGTSSVSSLFNAVVLSLTSPAKQNHIHPYQLYAGTFSLVFNFYVIHAVHILIINTLNNLYT